MLGDPGTLPERTSEHLCHGGCGCRLGVSGPLATWWMQAGVSARLFPACRWVAAALLRALSDKSCVPAVQRTTCGQLAIATSLFLLCACLHC